MDFWQIWHFDVKDTVCGFCKLASFVVRLNMLVVPNSIWWSTVSKAFYKSTKTPQPVFPSWSYFLIILSVISLIKAWHVEYIFLNPNCKFQREHKKNFCHTWQILAVNGVGLGVGLGESVKNGKFMTKILF